MLRIPKVQLAILLFFIFLSTQTKYSIATSAYLLLASVGFSIAFDLLFAFLRKRRLFMPYAAIVTGLIISLIVAPDVTWYQIATTSAVAMGAKNFLRVSGRHIFNPAAIGLFIGGIVFKQYITWWGVSFQNITHLTLSNAFLFLILLLPIFVSGYRMGRLYVILTFVVAYTVFSHVFTFTFSLSSFITRLADPTIVFFATVMLPEPMTSPMNPERQVLFGLTVAVITQALSFPAVVNSLGAVGLLPDLFIPALLLGNLLFFKSR